MKIKFYITLVLLLFINQFALGAYDYEKNLDAIIESSQDNPDSILVYIDSLLQDAKANKNESDIAFCHKINALVYRQQGLYKKALESAINAQQKFEELKMMGHAARAQTTIATIFVRLNNLVEAFKNFKKALQIANSTSDYVSIAAVQQELGNYFYRDENLDSASWYYSQAEKNYLKAKDSTSALAVQVNKIALYINLDLDTTLSLVNKVFKNNSQLSSYNKTTLYNLVGASYYFFASDSNYYLDSSLVYYNKAIATNKSKDHFYKNLLYNKVNVFYAQNKHDSALQLYFQYNEINDSLNGVEVQKNLLEINRKYNLAKLEAKHANLVIKEQKATARAQLFAYVGIILLLVSLLIFVFYKNAKKQLKNKNIISLQKEKIFQNKIQELVNKTEIEKISGLLDGQETERKRVGQELHDRVGSLLASLKYHFENVFEEITLNPKTQELQKKANQLLAETFEEVRRISHNLETGILSKFGLESAAKDLLNSLNSHDKMQCELFYDVKDNLDAKIELVAYRILQEALTNILKYAKASKIHVTIVEEEGVLSMVIEDNGMGFDPKIQKKGIGLSNMENRAKSINGKLLIESAIGTGTTIIFETNI